MMSRRTAKAFDALINALVMTDQEHVAEVLDARLTAELVRKRDAERGVHTIAQPSGSSSLSRSAVVPSGSAIVTTSSAVAHEPSKTIQSSSVQCTPSPSGMYFFFLYIAMSAFVQSMLQCLRHISFCCISTLVLSLLWK